MGAARADGYRARGLHLTTLTLYRLSKARHATTAMSGHGAQLMGGRWNHAGQAAVYASQSLALAALETFVHLGEDSMALEFVYLRIRVPAEVAVQRCRKPPLGWQDEPAGSASVEYGSRWLRSGRTALLAVPSVIVPSEFNYVLNPAHRDFARLKVSLPAAFRFDARMWKP